MAEAEPFSKASFYQEASVATIKAHLQGLFSLGRYDQLRLEFSTYLAEATRTRGAFLLATYRSFNLFALERYSRIDEKIALQLVQLALPSYSGGCLEPGEQLEGLLLDFCQYWDWIAEDVAHLELFPLELQLALCTHLPELVTQLARTPMHLAQIDLQKPLRSALWLLEKGSDDKIEGLSGIGDLGLAKIFAAAGALDPDRIRRLKNPVLAEALLTQSLV